MGRFIELTLHEAIQKVLREANKPMSTSEIAEQINLQGLYQRGDSNPIPTSQISARVKNYANLFKRLPDNKIALSNEANFILDEVAFRMEDCLRGSVNRSSYLIHSLLFYARLSNTSVHLNFFGKYSIEEWKKKHGSAKTQNDSGVDNIETLKNDTTTNIVESPEDIKLWLRNAFKNIDTHFQISVWENFIIHQIESVSDILLLTLFKILCQYDFRESSINNETFGNFFNEYLNSGNRSMRDRGVLSTPESLNIGLSKLITIKTNDVLVDPFAGFCGTIIKASIANQNVKHSIVAFDIFDEAIAIGQMNLISNGINSWNYIKHDSLSEQTILFDGLRNNEIADWVVTIPPFNAIANHYKSDKSLFPLGVGGSSTNLHVQSVLRILKPGGKAVVVVPDGFLFNNDNISIRIRKYLVENNILKAVISLPPGVFQPFTGISTSIIILEKGSQINEDVFFLNLQKLPISHLSENLEHFSNLVQTKTPQEDTSILISKSEIKENNYQLNTNRYFSSRNELKDGYKSIRELIAGYFTNPTITSKDFHSDGEIPFINNSNLSTSSKDYFLNPQSIKNYVDADLVASKRLKVVKPFSILCSKIGTNLRPTLVEENAGFVTSGNILVLEIDRKIILPKYFISQLYLEYVTKQLASIEIGTAQTFLRVEDLLDVKIKVPTLGEQEYYLHGLDITSITGLVNEPESEYQVIKHIKHSYAQINDAIGSDILNLKNYIHQKAASKEPISLSDKVSARKDAATLETLFERIIAAQTTAGDLFSTIKNIIDLGQVEMHKDSVDFYEYLKSEKTYLESLGENLHINIFTELDSENMVIEIDKNQFKELLRNLVVNAGRHGYLTKTESKNLVFEIVQEDDPSKLTLNYYNDGLPLPDGFSFEDFKTFGKRYDSDKGSGLGGHLVALIINKHNGEIVHLAATDSFPIPGANRALKTGIHFKIILPKS